MRATKKNDGRGFQTMLENLFAEYERLGTAAISKVDPPVKIMGWGARRKVIFQANPWLDYAGTLAGGRAIHIEAKSTAGPTLAILAEDSNGSGIKHTQQTSAMRHLRMGAAVFYLWWNTAADDMRIVTPNMVAAQLATRKSLRWMDAHRIPYGPGRLIYDPLAFVLTAPEVSTTDPLPSDPYAGA